MPARHIVCLVLLSASSAFASPVAVTFKRAPDGDSRKIVALDSELLAALK